MKSIVIFGFAASAVLGPLPLTAQPQTPAKQAQSAAAPDVKTFDQRMAEAQAQMQRMQEQMDRLRQTQDPQERQALMNQHWTAMQNAMTAMRGAWEPGVMGCCTAGGTMMHGPGMMGGGQTLGWGNMHGYYSKLTPDQMKQRQYMLDRYMGMQQMMMDQMMQHQQWLSPTRPPAK